MSMMDYYIWALNAVSLLAGGAAIYFFLKIYPGVKRGSIAWLLLATTSIFLVATPLAPYAMRSRFDPEFFVLLSTYWSAVYAAFFAGAGFVLYRTFARVPTSSLGEFLLGEVRFERPALGTKPKNPQLAAMLGSSALVEYTPAVRYEDAASEIAWSCISHGRNVLLVTSQPRSAAYAREFSEALKENAIKIMSVGTKDSAKKNGAVVELSPEELYSLFEIIESLPENCAIIFESTSQLAERLGAESVFNFLLGAAERKKRGMSIVGFVNVEKHSKRELELLGELFVGRLRAGERAITQLKGGRGEVPFKNYIDYEAFSLR